MICNILTQQLWGIEAEAQDAFWEGLTQVLRSGGLPICFVLMERISLQKVALVIEETAQK